MAWCYNCDCDIDLSQNKNICYDELGLLYCSEHCKNEINKP